MTQEDGRRALNQVLMQKHIRALQEGGEVSSSKRWRIILNTHLSSRFLSRQVLITTT